MARSLIMLVAVAAMLAPFALAQSTTPISCYVTEESIRRPPPPPMTMPPLNLNAVPPVNTNLPPVTIDHKATLTALLQPSLGTQITVQQGGFKECFSYSYRSESVANAPAEGLKVVEEGTISGGIEFTDPTTCAQYKQILETTINTAIANKTPAQDPVGIYTFRTVSNVYNGGSCCSTNLCNSAQGLTTRLSARTMVANVALLTLSAMACLALGKML